MSSTTASHDGVAGGGETTHIRGLVTLLATLAVGMLLIAVGDMKTVVPFVGVYLLSSIAPALVIAEVRPRRWILALAMVLCVMMLVGGLRARQANATGSWDERHDGGVVATGAAADMVRSGENPYVTDFTAALAPDHDMLPSEPPIVNPLVEHYPYLPLAFLLQVPVSVAAGLVGLDPDPRLLYGVFVAGAVVVLARLRRPGWARAATLVAMAASGTVVSYLSWGANDSAAASLVLVGGYLCVRRPKLAGLALGCAIALKVLLLVTLVPLAAMLVLRSRRRDAVAMVTSSVGLVVVTSLPFLVMDPSAFFEDTVAFNLGRTDLIYPTSGVGLGARMPDVFTDGVIAASSILLLVVVALAGLWALRRNPTVGMALFIGGALVAAGLLPARSFQMSYFPLMVVLWAPIWTEVGSVPWRMRSNRSPAPDRVFDPAT